MNPPSIEERSQASLMLGAVGDALGAPVEFLDDQQINDRYGPDGITSFDKYYRKHGPVTDDTQMSLYAADALTEAHNTFGEIVTPEQYVSFLTRAYITWLSTQQNRNVYGHEPLASKQLHKATKKQGSRAPGHTCVTALLRKKELETPAENSSKGCGTVMRAAPIGIFAAAHSDSASSVEFAYRLGMLDAGITHGHQDAHHASGLQASLIAKLAQGATLTPELAHQTFENGSTFGINTAFTELGHRAVQHAIDDPFNKEVIDDLGEAWVADEAFVIALYCALSYELSDQATTHDTLQLAVNHRGDSDSTGAITGNILGAAHGLDSLPQELLSDEKAEVTKLQPLILDIGQHLVSN